MDIKDIKSNQGNIDIVADVMTKEEPRSFEKFGKVGKVCNAKLKDTTGEIKLTLWNDDIENVNEGDRVHLQNGWCSEFKGEKQLSTGKFGKIEVVSGSAPKMSAKQSKVEKAEKPKTFVSNDPDMFGKAAEEDLEETEEETAEDEF